MTRSTETSHGRPNSRGELRHGGAASVRAAGVNRIGRIAGRLRERAPSGTVTRPRSPREPSSVDSASAHAEPLEVVEVKQLLGVARPP